MTTVFATSGVGATTPGLISNDVVPLVFDVWVDGQHSRRTTFAGVPLSGSIGNAWINFIPTTNGASLIVDMEVVITGGGSSHTIGIGYEGHNGGVKLIGGIGTVLEARFTWNAGFGAIVGLGSCDKTFTVRVGGPVTIGSITPNVPVALFTRGSSFSLRDPLWIQADGAFLGKTVSVRSVDCGNTRFTVVEPPASGVNRVEVQAENWTIILNNNPGTVRIDRDDMADWDDGWRISTSNGAWGHVYGQVEKGIKIPIEAKVNGADVFTVHWKGSYPWLRIGARFVAPFNYAEVHVLGHFDFDIVQQPNGIVHFVNPLAGDRYVPAGTCQGAYWGSLLECGATNWF
ncbi:MAG: hypothetical protein ACLGIK_08470 [Gemmatimonadota bacterium]